MSDNPNADEIPVDGPDPRADTDRRAFLTRSSALVALLATSCATTSGTSGARATASSDAAGINRVVDLAIANGGDVQLAASQSGMRLSSDTLSVLNSLTREDWQAAARLQTRLDRLRAVVADNNNGVIGM